MKSSPRKRSNLNLGEQKEKMQIFKKSRVDSDVRNLPPVSSSNGGDSTNFPTHSDNLAKESDDGADVSVFCPSTTENDFEEEICICPSSNASAICTTQCETTSGNAEEPLPYSDTPHITPLFDDETLRRLRDEAERIHDLGSETSRQCSKANIEAIVSSTCAGLRTFSCSREELKGLLDFVSTFLLLRVRGILAPNQNEGLAALQCLRRSLHKVLFVPILRANRRLVEGNSPRSREDSTRRRAETKVDKSLLQKLNLILLRSQEAEQSNSLSENELEVLIRAVIPLSVSKFAQIDDHEGKIQSEFQCRSEELLLHAIETDRMTFQEAVRVLIEDLLPMQAKVLEATEGGSPPLHRNCRQPDLFVPLLLRTLSVLSRKSRRRKEGISAHSTGSLATLGVKYYSQLHGWPGTSQVNAEWIWGLKEPIHCWEMISNQCEETAGLLLSYTLHCEMVSDSRKKLEDLKWLISRLCSFVVTNPKYPQAYQLLKALSYFIVRLSFADSVTKEKTTLTRSYLELCSHLYKNLSVVANYCHDDGNEPVESTMNELEESGLTSGGRQRCDSEHIARMLGESELIRFGRCFYKQVLFDLLLRRMPYDTSDASLAPVDIPSQCLDPAWRTFTVLRRAMTDDFCEIWMKPRRMLSCIFASLFFGRGGAQEDSRPSNRVHSDGDRREPTPRDRSWNSTKPEASLIKIEPVVEPDEMESESEGVRFETAAKELLRLSLVFDYHECPEKGDIRVREGSNFITKAWQRFLIIAEVPSEVEKMKTLLKRVITTRLLHGSNAASVSNSLKDLLVEHFLAMLTSDEPMSLEVFSPEVRTFLESVLKDKGSRFGTRRIVITALCKAVSLFASSRFRNDPTAFYSYLSGTSVLKVNDRIETRVENAQSDVEDFLSWCGYLLVSHIRRETMVSLQLKAWRGSYTCLSCLPLGRNNYRIIEDWIQLIGSEQNRTFRDVLIESMRQFFFSREACKLTEYYAKKTGSPAASEGACADRFPDIHEWSSRFVSTIILAELRELEIVDEEGRGSCLLESLISERTDSMTKGKGSTSNREADQAVVARNRIMLLIDFFIFCRKSRKKNSVTCDLENNQRCALQVLRMLGEHWPEAILPVVPLIVPYLAAVPSRPTEVQLIVQVCHILGLVVDVRPDAIGSVQETRRIFQPQLLSLSRVHGTLSDAAIKLIMKILSQVTGDYSDILTALFARDFSVVFKGIRKCVVQQDPDFASLLASPLLQNDQKSKIGHSFAKIASLLTHVDLQECFSTSNANFRDVPSPIVVTSQTKTPTKNIKTELMPASGRKAPLDVTAVFEWIGFDPNQLPAEEKSVTNLIVILYDGLCDIYSALQSLHLHLCSSTTEGKPGDVLSQSANVLGCIAAIPSGFPEFLASSRLKNVLEHSLSSDYPPLIEKALNLMTSSLKQHIGRPSSQVSEGTMANSYKTPNWRTLTSYSKSAGRSMGGRTFQHLCAHLPAVYALLTIAPESLALPSAKLSVTHQQTAVLEFLAELLAQGLVPTGDLLEPAMSSLFIEGAGGLRAQRLCQNILKASTDAAALLRRKGSHFLVSAMPLIGNLVTSKDPRTPLNAQKPLLLEDIQKTDVFRPVSGWFNSIQKMAWKTAFLAALVSSLTRTTSYCATKIFVQNVERKPTYGSNFSQKTHYNVPLLTTKQEVLRKPRKRQYEKRYWAVRMLLNCLSISASCITNLQISSPSDIRFLLKNLRQLLCDICELGSKEITEDESLHTPEEPRSVTSDEEGITVDIASDVPSHLESNPAESLDECWRDYYKLLAQGAIASVIQQIFVNLVKGYHLDDPSVRLHVGKESSSAKGSELRTFQFVGDSVEGLEEHRLDQAENDKPGNIFLVKLEELKFCVAPFWDDVEPVLRQLHSEYYFFEQRTLEKHGYHESMAQCYKNAGTNLRKWIGKRSETPGPIKQILGIST